MSPRRRRRLPLAVAIVVLLGGVGWMADIGWHAIFSGHKTPVVSSCRVAGPIETYAEDPDQMLNASIIADVAMQRGLPERAVVVALATAQQESKLRNLGYGDADSVGLFQQRPTQGWGSKEQILQPTYAAGKFYDALLKVPNWQQLPVTQAASKVQRNAYPDAYASWEPRATALAGALTGTTSGALACRLVSPGVAADRSASDSSPPSASPAPGVLLDASVGAITTGLRTDLAVEHPSVLVVDTRTRSITVTGLIPDAGGDDTTAQHRVASVAAWALAHAARDGLTSVVVGDREWRADRGTWTPAKVAAAPDAVVMTVALAATAH